MEGVSDSEMESISNLASRIKYQSIEIRATRDLAMIRGYNVLNNFSTEMTVSEEALYYKKKVKRMRKRDLITYKLKNNLELSKYENRMWEKKTTSHIWSQCPNLKECVNAHCWRTQKTQKCDK